MSIEVKNLYKYYGNQAAVKDISFTVNSGEIVGFLGPNGAGKSTTMKIITGFIPSSGGEVKVCGLPVDVDSLDTRKKIGYLPEHNPLYLDMYVKEYLEFVGNIYKIKNVRQRVAEMIKAVGLEVEQSKKIGMLSKGYRQRVGLAAAIIHDPEVLILDEPTSGLDPNQLVEIRDLIKSIGKKKTVMLSTHIMQEVEAICDRVVIINKGEIVADDKASVLQHRTTVQTVYVEFEDNVSKAQLQKISHVRKVEQVRDGWLLETIEKVDLRRVVSKHASENNWLTLTLKIEEKSLEEVCKIVNKHQSQLKI
jgi:ABC-2 type transport system ATP-binding protein